MTHIEIIVHYNPEQRENVKEVRIKKLIRELCNKEEVSCNFSTKMMRVEARDLASHSKEKKEEVRVG